MPKKETGEILSDIKLRFFTVSYTTRTPLLGGRPLERVTDEYLHTMIRGRLGTVFDELSPKEQLKEIKKWREKTISSFRRHIFDGTEALCLGGLQIKAALKESARVCRLTQRIKGLTDAIRLGLSVCEEFVPLLRDGEFVVEPDDLLEGFVLIPFPRTTAIRNWELVCPPAVFAATLSVISPLLTDKVLKKLCQVACDVGFGSGRAHGHGKAELTGFRVLKR